MSSMKKRGLGKGLSALVEENIVDPLVEIVPNFDRVRVEGGNKGEFMVSPDVILPSRYQPRKEFDDSFLEELSESIKKYGIVQPLVVSDLGDGTYELVAGERRLRASKLAGLDRVPVVIREFEEKDRLAVALIENIQRADLNAIEIAEAYQEMIDRMFLTQEEVALIVGKSRTSVTNTLRLLKLPESIRVKIINHNISEGHGRSILVLYPNFQKMEEVAHLIEINDLSVRQTEDLVRKVSVELLENSSDDNKNKKISYQNERILALEEKLVKNLGAKIKITGNEAKGSIKIFYHNAEELEILIQNMLKNRDY